MQAQDVPRSCVACAALGVVVWLSPRMSTMQNLISVQGLFLGKVWKFGFSALGHGWQGLQRFLVGRIPD